MDNLQVLKTATETVYNPAGAPYSILASEVQALHKEYLDKLGRYTGFPFLSKRDIIGNNVNNGYIFWQGIPLNQEADFELIMSGRTFDGNDMEKIFLTINSGDLVHYKDYNGRSALLKYSSYKKEVDVNNRLYFRVALTSYADNPDYTYLANEPDVPCFIEFIRGAGFSKLHRGNMVIFRRPSNVTTDLQSGDVVEGFWSDTLFIKATYNGGDQNDINNYTISEESEYDPI